MNLAEDFITLMTREEGPRDEFLPYICDGPLGKMINHPLVQVITVDLTRCALYNKQYEAKHEAAQQALKEGNWGRWLAMHERPYRFDALVRIIFDVDDKTYWSLLSDMWSDSENIWQNFDDWRDLWESDRPGKHHAMDAAERRHFKLMSRKGIVIYRGCFEDLNEHGMSWTRSHERAAWFARRYQRDNLKPMIIHAEVDKRHVHALLLGRGEEEIVTTQYRITKRERLNG